MSPFRPAGLHLPLLLLAACSGRPALGDSASATVSEASSTSTSIAGTSTGPDPATSEPPQVTTGMSSGTDVPVPEDSTSADPGCGFLCPPDIPHSFHCDPWVQDCPEGHKCTNTNGLFDTTECTLVVRDPKKVGEPCTMDVEPPASDDCEFGALCWDIDPETGVGTCHALCIGTPDSPHCADPSKFCWPWCQSCIIQICIDRCDPLGDDCNEGDLCLDTGSGEFACVLDASGDEGQYGDPCEYLNACDPGLACIPSDLLPGCDSTGCCTPFCDLTAPACPDAALGVQCVAWYEPTHVPPGLENLGACVLPP